MLSVQVRLSVRESGPLINGRSVSVIDAAMREMRRRLAEVQREAVAEQEGQRAIPGAVAG